MKPSKKPGNISEIFASICGEGLNVGTMQLFIRLADCNDSCRYCQNRNSGGADESFALRPWPGPGTTRINNPITPDKLIHRLTDHFPLSSFHSVSFIGAEPACQADFVAETTRMLHRNDIKVTADTSAPQRPEIKELLELIDFWSITITRPGKTAAAIKNQKKLAAILESISPLKNFLRIIINSDDDPDDYLDLFAQLAVEDFTLIIQPSSIPPARINDWDTATIMEWVKIFQPHFAQIRWIPQVHKLLRIP